MKRRWLMVSLAAAVVIALVVRHSLQDDVIVLANASGSNNGVLVNAQGSAGVLTDQVFTSGTNTVDVGKLTAAASRNEVIAFTNSRPVAIAPLVAWTSGFDSVPLSFANEIQISVTFWIVDTPLAGLHALAANHCAAAAPYWTAERMGVAFAPGGCDIRDATAVATVSQFRGSKARSFQCAAGDQQRLQTAIPPVAGRVNVYVVHSVNAPPATGTGAGTTCGTSDFVALGSTAIDGTFVHEMGHTFSLIHVDGMPSFDDTNFMYSVSAVRAYFSEGQLFRAHFTPAIPAAQQPGSSLNSVYNARPSLPTRDCTTEPCPVLEKRIWADGAFPPN
jgi:Peptidase M66